MPLDAPGCPYISLYAPISLYVPICPSMSLYVPICPCMSLYVPLCPYMSLYVPMDVPGRPWRAPADAERTGPARRRAARGVAGARRTGLLRVLLHGPAATPVGNGRPDGRAWPPYGGALAGALRRDRSAGLGGIIATG